MPHIRMDQQIFQQIKRGGIDPLQIVEEERQRMLRSGEHSEKAPKNHLKAPLHLLRRQLGDGALFTNDEFQLRDQVQHELAIGTQRVTERLLKRADDETEAACLTNKATLLGSIEKLTDEAVDRMFAAVDADRPYLLKVAELDVATYVSHALTLTADARACSN